MKLIVIMMVLVMVETLNTTKTGLTRTDLKELRARGVTKTDLKDLITNKRRCGRKLNESVKTVCKLNIGQISTMAKRAQRSSKFF
jgi:hypothetical protein